MPTGGGRRPIAVWPTVPDAPARGATDTRSSHFQPGRAAGMVASVAPRPYRTRNEQKPRPGCPRAARLLPGGGRRRAGRRGAGRPVCRRSATQDHARTSGRGCPAEGRPWQRAHHRFAFPAPEPAVRAGAAPPPSPDAAVMAAREAARSAASLEELRDDPRTASKVAPCAPPPPSSCSPTATRKRA